MRELKFRAYDNINKEWLLGYKECGGFSMFGVLMLMGEWQAILHKMFKDEFGKDGKELFVQQYTGLKDKDGVDIYEGDIIKVGFGENKGSLGKVIFEYGTFMLTSKYGCNFMDTYKSCLYGEVIGNIFENSELLEK